MYCMSAHNVYIVLAPGHINSMTLNFCQLNVRSGFTNVWPGLFSNYANWNLNSVLSFQQQIVIIKFALHTHIHVHMYRLRLTRSPCTTGLWMERRLERPRVLQG